MKETQREKIKIKQRLLLILNGIILLALKVNCGSTTLVVDNYRKVRSVAKDMFVVVGDTHIHLYDKDLNYLRNVAMPVLNSPVDIVTTNLLNYTLIRFSKGSRIMYIRWDGSNSPHVINEIRIKTIKTFQSITCLDDSTLCFAYG